MISGAGSSADDAKHLAALFAGAAQDVDEYRSRHLRELTPKLRGQLEEAVQQLDEANDTFASVSLRKTLSEIEEDLDEIAAVAARARQALRRAKSTAAAASLAGSIAALASAIAGADSGAVPGALEDLTEALQLQPAGSQSDED